jgi:hypothetical protein
MRLNDADAAWDECLSPFKAWIEPDIRSQVETLFSFTKGRVYQVSAPRSR